MERYDWQKTLFNKWQSNDYKGILKAVPRAGKTLPAIDIINLMKVDTIIIVSTTTLKRQWEEELNKHILPNGNNIEVIVINTACKNEYETDLLIIDEVHRSTSPKFSKIYKNIKYNFILGLSANSTVQSILSCS
jgi:superfamily II DNA or RNA helicase